MKRYPNRIELVVVMAVLLLYCVTTIAFSGMLGDLPNQKPIYTLTLHTASLSRPGSPVLKDVTDVQFVTGGIWFSHKGVKKFVSDGFMLEQK
jgi:hypothetical protein